MLFKYGIIHLRCLSRLVIFLSSFSDPLLCQTALDAVRTRRAKQQLAEKTVATGPVRTPGVEERAGRLGERPVPPTPRLSRPPSPNRRSRPSSPSRRSRQSSPNRRSRPSSPRRSRPPSPKLSRPPSPRVDSVAPR